MSQETATRRVLVSLDAFEGPLDLLLHVIRQHRVDIFDIPIATITTEYLMYIEAMSRHDLPLASDYLQMAATLLHIKSRLLLPNEPGEDADEEPEDEDPREALVRRLLAYQRFRLAAEALEALPRLERDVFRSPDRAWAANLSTHAPLFPGEPLQLARTLATLQARRPDADWHVVAPERMTIRATILRIAETLDDHPRTTLRELCGDDDAETMIAIFLALLEMAKLRLIRLFQLRLLTDDLAVERAVLDGDALQGRLALVDGWQEETAGSPDGRDGSVGDRGDSIFD